MGINDETFPDFNDLATLLEVMACNVKAFTLKKKKLIYFLFGVRIIYIDFFHR